MNPDITEHRISSLYFEILILITELIAIIIFSFMAMAVLPSVLIQTVYRNQQLLQAPAVIQYIPFFFFALATGFFVYVVLRVMQKWQQVTQLRNQYYQWIESMDTELDLDELDVLVEREMAKLETVKKPTKKTTIKKKTTKK